MTQTPHSIVVAPTAEISEQLVDCLRPAGHQIRVVTELAAAQHEFDLDPPDLIITEMKLGAFNGLQLAIRAREGSTAVIVVGDPDLIAETEARKYHALYLPLPLGGSLTEMVQRLLGDGRGRAAHAATLH